MATEQLPDVETLRKLLDFDPETGVFVWKLRPESMFSKKGYAQDWNKRFAGKEALNYLKKHKGYFWGTILRRTYQTHRVAWAIHYGAWPTQSLDHINGIKTDNRICNLRQVTKAQNGQNSKIPRNNTSGVIGVHWRPRQKRWVGTIVVNMRQIHLGTYKCKQEAINARKAAERKYGFHPNHGRPP